MATYKHGDVVVLKKDIRSKRRGLAVLAGAFGRIRGVNFTKSGVEVPFVVFNSHPLRSISVPLDNLRRATEDECGVAGTNAPVNP